MAKKLFIGNLPFSMDEEQLTALFAQYGEVASLNIVKDKFNGRSKGFGFVEYTSESDAQKALTALDGSEQAGRNIAVKEAIARPENTEQQ